MRKLIELPPRRKNPILWVHAGVMRRSVDRVEEQAFSSSIPLVEDEPGIVDFVRLCRGLFPGSSGDVERVRKAHR
jgi:hypothetical protein